MEMAQYIDKAQLVENEEQSEGRAEQTSNHVKNKGK